MKPTSQATAAASGGVVGAIVTILIWVLSLWHVDVPAEIAAAMMVILTPCLHMFAVWIGVTISDPR